MSNIKLLLYGIISDQNISKSMELLNLVNMDENLFPFVSVLFLSKYLSKNSFNISF